MNVKGDGDCFYRALATCLGYDEESRDIIKDMMADYIINSKQVFDYLGNVEDISREIRKPRCAAKYEFLKIATECF